MHALIAASLPMVELIWTRETEGVVLDSPERRAALDSRLKAHLARIADPGLRAHYQAEIRSRRAALFAPAPRQSRPDRQGGKTRAPAIGSAAPATRASLLGRTTPGVEAEARIRECAILAGCLNNPGLVAAFEERLDCMPFTCADLAGIRDALLSAFASTPDHAGLLEAVAARIGRDPMSDLLAPGHVSANRHLRAGADSDLAARAIEEELTRHAAIAGWRAELIDAVRELNAETAESVGWRLRDAAEAAHLSASRPISESAEVDAEAEEMLSAGLQNLLDRQIWKKPRKT
jgi:DNA primase